jgi:hypothetical protein
LKAQLNRQDRQARKDIAGRSFAYREKIRFFALFALFAFFAVQKDGWADLVSGIWDLMTVSGDAEQAVRPPHELA